jgi:hypothetical protein
VGNGTLTMAPDKIAAVRDWPLPETQKLIKSFVQCCSYYGKFIHHFSDCAAPLTDTCRKNLPGNVVHTDATKAAFETLKARMISAPVLLTPKARHDAKFVVTTDASKVDIVGVLFQEDTSRSMRPCAYWARKLKDCKTRYSAYDREALVAVEVVSRVWRLYLLGCKCFLVVTDHATLAYLLKQSSDKLTDRQVHWAERLMPFAQNMSILYRKGSVNEADLVSRRPDFFHPDDIQLRRPAEMFALWWDGNVSDLCYQNNDIALLVLLANTVSVDDDFLTKFSIMKDGGRQRWNSGRR